MGIFVEGDCGPPVPRRNRPGERTPCPSIEGTRRLFADIGEQPHESGPLDRGAQCSLVCRAGASSLTAVQFALGGAHFLEVANILVIHERRPRAAFFRAEATAVFLISAQLFADHNSAIARYYGVFGERNTVASRYPLGNVAQSVFRDYDGLGRRRTSPARSGRFDSTSCPMVFFPLYTAHIPSRAR